MEEQLRGNPLLASGQIVVGHGRDQLLEFHRDPGPAGARPPAPDEPESIPVPADERGGLDNRERLAPREAAREQDEREPERIRRAARLHLPLAVEGEVRTPGAGPGGQSDRPGQD